MVSASKIQCKAAVAWAPNEQLKIETIEVLPPEAGEVRIRLSAASICHTDRTIWSGANLGIIKPRFPIILGHEGAGIVESVGEGVTSVQVGDSVILVNIPQCRKCKYCKNPKTNACIEYDEKNIGLGFIDKKRTTRFQCRGETVHHCIGVSSFSEYTVCREEFVAKIDPSADKDNASILSCAVLTGYGAALNSAKVEPGSICGVWGLGGVGLGAVLGCKKAGAKRIIAIDINPGKFDTAIKFGATDCLNPGDKSFCEAISQITEGEGLDYAIECVGKMAVMRQGLEMVNRYWGLLTIVGGSSADEEFCVGDAMQFLVGKRVNGSWLGGYKTRDALPRLIEEENLPLGDFITHRIKLDKINDGFELMKSGECIKTVIKFND